MNGPSLTHTCHSAKNVDQLLFAGLLVTGGQSDDDDGLSGDDDSQHTAEVWLPGGSPPPRTLQLLTSLCRIGPRNNCVVPSQILILLPSFLAILVLLNLRTRSW